MRALLKDLPANLRQGAKVALAAVLAYGVAAWAGLLYPYIAVVSAVIVIQTYVADTIQMALYRVSGTIIGCLLSIAALHLVPPGAVYVAAGLFVAIFICAFLISYTSHFRMAAITVAIVYLAGLHAESRTAFALERTLEIVIGVLCALLVSVAVFPERAVQGLRRALAGFFGEAADRLDELLGLFFDLQRPVPESRLAELDHRHAQCRDLLGKALKREAWFFSANKEQVVREFQVASRVHEALHGIAHALAAPCGEGVRFIIEPEMGDLGKAVVVALRARAEGGKEAEDGLGEALERSDARLAELRALNTTKRLELGKIAQFYAAYQALHGAAELLLGRTRSAEQGAD